MEFAAPRSLVGNRLAGPSGSPLPATSTFLPCRAVSHRLPSTAGLHPQLHPPTSFASPSECYDPRPAPRLPLGLATAREARSASLGVRSLIATPAGGVHSDPPGFPNPSSGSVRDVSHVLDGLLRHANLRLAARVSSIILGLAAPNDLRPCGLVSSRCHVQGSPFRGLSLPTEPHRVSPAVAFMPFDPPTCGLTRASEWSVDFKALLPAESAVPRRGI